MISYDDIARDYDDERKNSHHGSRSSSGGRVAIYHFSAQVISRKAGRSSVAAAAYRSGMELTDERTGEVRDYTRKDGVLYSEIAAPENAPEWAKNRERLWNEVEAAEKRKDAQLCREFNAALPCALTPDQQKALVREFVSSNFKGKGMICDWSIHNADGKNPHVHMMTTMREIGPEGFGKKNREWNKKEVLQEQRKQWAKITNKHLERVGEKVRVDHRTLKAQGIDRTPTIHLGPKPHPERVARAEAIQKANEELRRINIKLRDLSRDQLKLTRPKQEQSREARTPEKRKEPRQTTRKPRQRSQKSQKKGKNLEVWTEASREAWRRSMRKRCLRDALRSRKAVLTEKFMETSPETRLIVSTMEKAKAYDAQSKKKQKAAEEKGLWGKLSGKSGELKRAAQADAGRAEEAKKDIEILKATREANLKAYLKEEFRKPETQRLVELSAEVNLAKRERFEERSRAKAAAKIAERNQKREEKKQEAEKLKGMTLTERKAYFKEKRSKEKKAIKWRELSRGR
jgi:hypothetical protein